MVRGIVFVGIILFLAGAALGNTIDVPGDYPTIQAAIDAAANGDTIRVAPGTYLENIVFKGKAIVLESTHGAGVTFIDGNQQGSVVSFIHGEGPGSMLEGFSITNGLGTYLPSYNTCGGGIYLLDSGPTLFNNIVQGNHAEHGAGICGFGASPVIASNTITENSAAKNGGGICCIESSSFDISNTILWQNHATNMGHEISIGTAGNPSTLFIRYSDVEGGKSSVHLEQGCTLDWGSGMIDADPQFCDPVSHDFRLRQHPCETGIDNSCVHGGDPDTPWIKGTTRTDGLQDEDVMDMGCHYAEKYHDADKQYHNPDNTWVMFYTDNNGNNVHDPGEPCGTTPGPQSRGDATCWMNAASNLLSYEGFGYHRPDWIKDGGAHSPSYQPWTLGASYVEGGGMYRTFDDGGYTPWPFWMMGVTYQAIMSVTEMGAGTWAENPVAWCEKKLAEGHPVGISVWSGNIPRDGGVMPRGIFPGDKFYYHVITLWAMDTNLKTVTITDSDDAIDGPRTLFYTYSDFDWIILDLYPGFRKFRVNSATCVSSLLQIDNQVIDANAGATLDITLDAGKENAQRMYMLIGSLSGTVPGTPLPGGEVLPLNWDFFTSLSVLHANSAFFKNFMGTLDGSGKASATFLAPAYALAPVVREYLNFAYVLGGPMDFVSNPVPVQIVD